MTKTIKISALFAAILILIGTFFKTSHWPGANIIMVTGTAVGIFAFIMMISRFTGKLVTGFEQFNGIFASLAVILGLLTFVFKLLHWPGAGILVWIADIGIMLSAVFFLIDGIRDTDEYKSSLKLIAGFFILLLALVVVLA
jgi:hypothetical protein